jgi:hypothetical protein
VLKDTPATTSGKVSRRILKIFCVKSLGVNGCGGENYKKELDQVFHGFLCVMEMKNGGFGSKISEYTT